MTLLLRVQLFDSFPSRRERARLARAFVLLAAATMFTVSALAQAPVAAAAGEYVGDAAVTYTTIDYPGAAITNVTGINSSGVMVGDYSDATYNSPSHGFIYSNGVFTSFDYPGGESTITGAINDSGVIAGYADIHQYTASNGFLYNGTRFTTVRIQGQTATFVEGINNAGDVVGAYGSFSSTKGFELVGKKVQTISPPGVPFIVFANGINNLGEIVGSATASSVTGWAYKNGKFLTLVVPGSSGYTEALGVNDSGMVVGLYSTTAAFYGFAMLNGRYVSLAYPGAIETIATGVNNLEEVVGEYQLPDFSWHGFKTTAVSFTHLGAER